MFGTSTHRRRKPTQTEETTLDVLYSLVEEPLEEAITGLPPVERRALDNFQHALGSQGYREEIEQGILEYYTSSGGRSDDLHLPDNWRLGADPSQAAEAMTVAILQNWLDRIIFPDPVPPPSRGEYSAYS